jgi:S-adenosylmethionine:tRNA ribosyltransferase-isomerase
MIAAREPLQRAADAKLLAVDACGRVRHAKRDTLFDYLRAGDLLIANDAATLPASLGGSHERTGGEVEVRLAGRRSLSPRDVRRFSAIVFGAGDFRIPTERRPAPPMLSAGDRLSLGPLRATVTGLLGHPRLISIAFDGRIDSIWAGIARHGRPIQYAHMTNPLSLWDVWTAVAGPPVAFEPPSASFVLDWHALGEMRRRGIAFATITHAAGISSTGDEALDAHLPFDEPYEIPVATATAINRARAEQRRIVAIGTTVVRALEHAAGRVQHEANRKRSPHLHPRSVQSGSGIATQRITPATNLRIVDVILSGVHEPTTSHYQLLGAFATEETLRQADEMMTAENYRTHEFGDSVLIERADVSTRRRFAESRSDWSSASVPA